MPSEEDASRLARRRETSAPRILTVPCPQMREAPYASSEPVAQERPMFARDLMTTDPVCVTPTDNVQMVARLMRDRHFGAIPVIRGDHSRFLLGIVTDRDLALRVLAQGKPLDTPVEEVMSAGVSCCLPDTPVEDVEQIMIQRQVRRVPVVDTTGACLGMIALGDVARAAVTGQEIQDREVGRIVGYISAPADVARTEADVGVYPERLQFAMPRQERWPGGSRAPREISP